MSLMWMGVATVVAAACSSVAESRQVQVNLTTSFLASPLHPVLETSEYLSQDNPALFFTYVAAVDVRYNAIKDKNNANYTKVALEAAADVLPADSSVSRLLPFVLQTRAHSPSIELFNQVNAYESSLLPTTLFLTLDTQTCAASGQHDFQLPVDHVYPSPNAAAAATAPHVIVYGALISPSFRAFHSTFVPLAVAGNVHYIVRHAPTDNTLPVLVHGYGPWQLTQLGYLATQYIMAAEDPLKRLQLLSQNFPKYASSLVLASKPVPQQTIDDINHARSQRLYNRIVVNGLPVDFNEYGFNAFDFLKSLNGELRLADTLAKLDPTGSIKAAMGSLSSAPSDVRISLRGPVDGHAPLYLNSIETDEETAEWPTDLGSLRGPSWSLIYLRKAMYELILVVDPTTKQGINAMNEDVATVFHVSKMFLAARANGKSARDKYLREVLIQAAIHDKALAIFQSQGDDALVTYLTNVCASFAADAHSGFSAVFASLVTHFHDGYIMSNLTSSTIGVQAMGYPLWWLQAVGYYNSSTSPASGSSTVLATVGYVVLVFLALGLGFAVGQHSIRLKGYAFIK
ncbi:hypothetical protein B5M09_003101 [Aphanomyces astaci]|uniref:Uncharacterized protein n=1 Tax=Aphanomyces astaci TaxID=112090 RepID=A0A425D1A0_APHAT|nr:hypothetical protein B5M09_003101 [Aphanomyces astaci]